MRFENPAFNYDRQGQSYSHTRQTDPRIAAYVEQALGNAATVLNVGAGTGSYEPANRYIIAVEPSVTMRSQRQRVGKIPAVIGRADALPFDDRCFEAAMAVLTVHHWPDMHQGLQEVKRVTRGPVVVMTFDPDSLDKFWNARYFPQVIESERRRYPTISFSTRPSAAAATSSPSPFPWIVSTASRKPSTAGRKPSCKKRSANHSRPGVS